MAIDNQTQTSERQAYLVEAMVEAKLCHDKTQARRLIIQGAVKLNGNEVNELGATIDKGKEYIIQVGTREIVWFIYR